MANSYPRFCFVCLMLQCKFSPQRLIFFFYQTLDIWTVIQSQIHRECLCVPLPNSHPPHYTTRTPTWRRYVGEELCQHFNITYIKCRSLLRGKTLPITNICGPGSFCYPLPGSQRSVISSRNVFCIHQRNQWAKCEICCKFWRGSQCFSPPLCQYCLWHNLLERDGLCRAELDTCGVIATEALQGLVQEA